MHPRVKEFINDNADLIEAAEWDRLFDRMYIAFSSNLWIYPILEVLENGLPEYTDELKELQVTKYKEKVIALMKKNNTKSISSTLLLGQLRNSLGLTTDRMKEVIVADSRFKVKTNNRYDYQITLVE